MSGYIPVVDRTQITLLPEAVDDFIGPDNPVRVIDAFVDQVDLGGAGFQRAVPAEVGRPGYDPRVLLKLYVYGYLNRVRSSRRLERETHRNVEVIWLCGRARPDHKTISDFRATHARALRQVFREFTGVCQRLELFGKELVGIDGSKLRAVNAKAQSYTPSELRRSLKRIDARIKEYLATLDAADRADDAAGVPGMPAAGTLQAKLTELGARQTEYQQLLAQLHATGERQVTLTDPESRRMKVKQGTEVCYNAQIAVDAAHHLIVAAEVTNAVTDVHQLAPMAATAKTALGVDTLEVVADRGYHNGAQVAQCVEQGITPLVPKPSAVTRAASAGFAKERFTYLPEQDAYRCPNEAVLPFRFEALEEGEPQRYYYDAAACTGCPLRPQCTGQQDASQPRRIKRWGREQVLEAMAARVAARPEVHRLRKSLVEHPFGTIKRSDDGSYFLVRGLMKVAGEFSLMALAYNLRRAIAVRGVPTILNLLRSRSSAPSFIASPA
ncbi:MAG TPA: IS1182 family transposase [Steroidobacteraceae bacterium]|nr:IS1182 family transposase [Steroidobacteraceae bacterium]